MKEKRNQLLDKIKRKPLQRSVDESKSNVMACERRSTDVVWLLEKSPTSSFPGNRLPSRGEVLQVFLFHHKFQKEVLFAAAASTVEKVLEVLRRADIPTSDVSWVKKKILKLYKEYGALAKSKSRKTETEEMKSCIFRDSLEDMFDIAHSKAMEAKIPDEDKAFLEAQREDRQSCSMAGVDEKLKRATEEKRRKRQRMEEMKKKDAAALSSTLDCDVALDLESSATSSSSNEETEDDDFKAPTPAKCPRRRPPKENKLTKELTLAWERDNLSIRAATSSYAAAAMCLSHDIEHITVPRSGNTGMVQGACIRIERALEKPLVWLACRHHILEVVLKDVFEACMGPSSGPNIALFRGSKIVGLPLTRADHSP
ncbi:hypothetical protein GWK47_054949 [Chionoecetes opilio]|uniref:Uncharacterized protein n=1 Tax=Chionoecetes opilio TaxID=41210 RepID=A0A8J5CPM2_CHIOP|nr:hypothetical protein GWK47_054949 [Chionoecetes opilio]